MFILVVGGGKVGSYLVKDLVAAGQEIALIEKQKEKCKRISEEYGATVINGDGCDPGVLQDAGAERADMIVAVTGDDEDNLIICQIAKRKFKVPLSIARVNNPKNEDIFKRLGIDATVSATNTLLSLIEQEVAYKGIMTTLPLKKGNVQLVETLITPESPAVGKPIKDLPLPSECAIAGVIREDAFLVPDGNTVLQLEDLVIALTRESRFRELKQILLGSEDATPTAKRG